MELTPLKQSLISIKGKNNRSYYFYPPYMLINELVSIRVKKTPRSFVWKSIFKANVNQNVETKNI